MPNMRIDPEISGVEVVLVGAFNPAIFTPAWFALHGLLSKRVAESAELQVAHNQVTAFRADWLLLQVTTERFSADTTQAPYTRVRDLVARVFTELLYHTPLSALGINRHVHFRMASIDEWDRIGRRLAPVSAWGSWREELNLDGESGGMTSLKMSQLRPSGAPEGSAVNITVEPSNRITPFGVYVGVNNHFASEKLDVRSAECLMELFELNFDGSIKMSDSIVEHVMSLAKTNKRLS